MTAELAIAARTIVAPAVAAFAAAWLGRRLLPAAIGECYALPVAVAAGFCAGFSLQPGAEFLPARHWHWLPYLALAAAFVGRSHAPSYWVWPAYAGLALASAWLLVPTWAKLWPPRAISIPLVAVYWLVLMGLVAALPPRLLGRTFAGLLTIAAVCTALLVVIGVTAKIGLVGLSAAAALFGGWAFTLLPATRDAEQSQMAGMGRGLIPVFAVAVGGLAYVGTITPTTPQPTILLAPLAPLALWLFAAGPLARLQGWKGAAAQTAAVILPLAILLARMLLGSGEEEW